MNGNILYGVMLFALVVALTVSTLVCVNLPIKIDSNYEDVMTTKAKEFGEKELDKLLDASHDAIDDVRERSEDKVKNDIGELFDRHKDFK